MCKSKNKSKRIKKEGGQTSIGVGKVIRSDELIKMYRRIFAKRQLFQRGQMSGYDDRWRVKGERGAHIRTVTISYV